MGEIQQNLIKNSEKKTGNTEVKNPHLKDGRMDPAVKEPSTQKIKPKEKTTNRVEETDEQKPGAY